MNLPPPLSDLKLHKIAATLKIPKPLLVTRAYCSEVTIRVPSWTAAEKFVQEPLSFRVVDLFIDVKNAADCDEAYCRAAEARAQAAIMEADPLGSIASWYAFSTIINERVEFIVDNVYIKLFSKGVSRVRVELTNFHSRTTNAMWQDMRDLTTCVDRSPDGLLKTRFKFVSFGCSILLTQSESAKHTESHHSKTKAKESASSSPSSLTILHDHAMSMRMTLFGHRQSKNEVWESLSQVIDVNLHTLPFDYDFAQMQQIYEVCATISGWLRDAVEKERAAAASGAGLDTSELLLHHHQVQRGAVMKQKSAAATEAGEEGDVNSEASFALQLTFRFSADATFRFVSERLGKQQITLSAHHAAVNLIVHHDNVRELQVTVHEVLARFQDQLVLYLKPDRDVMQLKQLRESIFVKWRLEKLACTIESDLALALNEAYHAYTEKTQSAYIKCGTCMQQIRLESIETHVCSPPPVRSPASSNASSSARHRSSRDSARSKSDASANDRESADFGSNGSLPTSSKAFGSALPPRLRLVFALNELELNFDSHLFHNVQQLMRTSGAADGGDRDLPDRKLTVRANDLRATTEAKEFVGDAIFVPVLPLAFQMLECTLQGCECIRDTSKKASNARSDSRARSSGSRSSASTARGEPSSAWLLRWPERLFLELGVLKCTARRTSSVAPSLPVESFFVAEQIALRANFSDGARICANCHPQLSAHSSVNKIRCQLDSAAFRFLKDAVGRTAAEREGEFVVAMVLFLVVLEIRVIEFALLQNDSSTAARLKNLFKQVIVVGDNQLGHLSLQSNFDFRSLFNSRMIRFFHRDSSQAAAAASDDGSGSKQPSALPSRHDRRRLRLEQEWQYAARSIQRLAQRIMRRHKPREDSEQGCGPEAAETASSSKSSGSAGSGSTSDHDGKCGVRREELVSSHEDDTKAHQRDTAPPAQTRQSSKSSASLFGVVPEEIVNANRKVVAAASVITSFVKTKQQQLESEVVGLAVHSKESAARLVMPPFTAYKKMFGRESAAPTAAKPKSASDSDTTLSSRNQQVVDMGSSSRSSSRVSSSSRSVEMDDVDLSSPRDGASCAFSSKLQAHTSAAATMHNESRSERAHANGGSGREDHNSRTNSSVSQPDCASPDGEDRDDLEEKACDEECEATEAQEEEDRDDASAERDDEDNGCDDEDNGCDDEPIPQQPEEESLEQYESEFPLSEEALVGELPSLLRVLVQVDENRLRVPINPREKVGFLCREIVRRFNEMFAAQSGVISHVVLQDARGGVFVPTDIVGFVYSSEAEVLYALPITADERVRCVARIEPCVSSTRGTTGRRQRSNRHGQHAGKKANSVGCSFARCSKLPLPLAIALLANENERDLVRCVLSEGSYGAAGGGNVNEWPELALDVSFLDPAHILPVEVRWFGKCLEVTNVDAFVLCLQQLGLCTTRASSKYVGKILRDRLKMNVQNPFVRSACMRSGDFNVSAEAEFAVACSEGREEAVDASNPSASVAAVSYASLKQIVQEDFSVYMT